MLSLNGANATEASFKSYSFAHKKRVDNATCDVKTNNIRIAAALNLAA